MPAVSGPVLDLDCIYCGQPNVVLPGVAAVTGTHIAWFAYAGQCVCIQFEAVEGEPMLVPIGELGAPYTYTFHVEQPDEAGPYSLTVDGTAYQLFRFCLKVPLVGQVVMIDAEGITCDNLNDPENGLTETQRVQCLLPTYTIGEFMEGLTDPQKAALIDWLCGGACATLCEMLAEVVDPLADVIPCLSEEAADALGATVMDSIGISILYEIPAGGSIDLDSIAVERGLAAGGSDDIFYAIAELSGGYLRANIIVPAITVRTTNGLTVLFSADGFTSAILLPPVRVPYVQADASPGTFNAGNVVSGDDTEIHAANTIPRITVFLSDGTTPYVHLDIVANTHTLPLQDVQNSVSTVVSQHEVGTPGVAPDATLNLNNTGGTPLIVGVSIPSGTVGNAIAPDATAVLKNTGGATLLTEAIPSGATENITAPDATVKTTDGVDTVQTIRSGSTGTLPQSRIKYTDAAGAAQVTAAANTEYTAATLRPATTIPRRPMKNSAGTTVGASQIDAAQLIADTVPIAPDARAVVRNSVPTTLSTTDIPAGVTTNLAVADSVITHPDATTSNLPATVALDVRNYRSGIAYNFGRMLHSGQTTAHRTGDEGSLLATGFFTYTPPVYPLSYAELGANFSTMLANNMHGNTLRFTKRDGTAAATSGNRTIQDHLTGLEWYIPNALPTADTWNNSIDAAEASSVDSSTDWHLPSDRALDSITDDSLNTVLNYAPFSISVDLWTGTTVPNASPVNARRLANVGGSIAGQAKTATNAYIYCRRFI